MASKVSINFASKTQLRRYLKISADLAQRIITRRQSQGYFHGPDDLVKVIGKQQTLRIQHVIDWSIPFSSPPIATPRRTWYGFIIGSFILPLAYSFLCFYHVFRLHDRFRSLLSGTELTPLAVSDLLLSSIGVILGGAGSIGNLVRSMTRNPDREAQMLRLLFAISPSLLVLMFLLNIIDAISGQNQLHLFVVLFIPAAVIMFVMSMFPRLLAFRWFTRLWSVSLLLAAAGSAYFTVVNITSPAPIPFPFALITWLWLCLGIISFRAGEPLYAVMLRLFLRASIALTFNDNNSTLITRFNRAFPDPRDRKVIAQYLEPHYQSRRSGLAMIVVVIFSLLFWLLNTMSSSVIEWAIGRYLDSRFVK